MTIIFSAKILDVISSGGTFQTAFYYVIGMICGNLLIEIILNSIQVLHIDAQNKTNNRAASQMLKEYMSVDYQYNESGEMMDLTQSFFLYVQPAEYLPVIGLLLTGVIQTVFSAYIALSIHPLILFAIIGFIILKTLCTKNLHKKDFRWSLDRVPYDRKFNYLKNAMTMTSFAKELRINGGRSWLKDKFIDVLNSYNLSIAKYCNEKVPTKICIVIIDVFQQVLIYLYFAYQVIRKSLSLGNFSMVLQVTSLFYASVNQIFEQASLLSNIADDVKTYIEYLKLVDEGVSSKGTRHMDELVAEIDLEFRNVSMIYPNTTQPVLKNVSFHIHPGEHVAIVGQNGAGKSTIIKLICRLYEPTEGEILLNGVNIQEYCYDEYMAALSVILQDFKLLAFSVRDNIVLNRSFDQQLFDYAIRVSDLKEKIDTLPDGINTIMYRQYDENGMEFSGGEAQRVALAREIYKNGKMIILDEPTSALDALTEYRIFEALNEITRDKTSIYISHRMSSVIFCNRIIVIKEGEIVEEGAHSELMSRKGEYYHLFTKQAENYIQH